MAIFYIKNDFILAQYSTQYNDDIQSALEEGYSIPFFNEYIDNVSQSHTHHILDNQQFKLKKIQPQIQIKPENYWSSIQQPVLTQDISSITFLNTIIINSINNNCQSSIADIIDEDIENNEISYVVLDTSASYQSHIFRVKSC